ncbi:tld family protein, putative, partial [Ichthyophthirius multifiliis]
SEEEYQDGNQENTQHSKSSADNQFHLEQNNQLEEEQQYITYTTTNQDTLIGLSIKFNISEAKIKMINGISDLLFPGLVKGYFFLKKKLIQFKKIIKKQLKFPVPKETAQIQFSKSFTISKNNSRDFTDKSLSPVIKTTKQVKENNEQNLLTLNVIKDVQDEEQKIQENQEFIQLSQEIQNKNEIKQNFYYCTQQGNILGNIIITDKQIRFDPSLSYSNNMSQLQNIIRNTMYVLIYKLENSIFFRFTWNQFKYVKKLISYLKNYNDILFFRLYRNVQDESPCILIIQTFAGDILGSYLSDPIQISTKFYGTGECFLFKFQDDVIQCYKSTGINEHYMFSDSEGLGVGCGEEKFGLYIQKDLFKGQTNQCQTYDNELLVSTNKNTFKIKKLEILGLDM